MDRCSYRKRKTPCARSPQITGHVQMGTEGEQFQATRSSLRTPPQVDLSTLTLSSASKAEKISLLKPPGRCGLLWTPKLTETPPLRASPAQEGWVDALLLLWPAMSPRPKGRRTAGTR